MATLCEIGEDGSSAEQWEIGPEPVVVGRSGQATVKVEDEGVSRRHFLILRDGEDYVIRDLSSRNGTWVDGRRVFAEKLRHNECILAGRTRFLFVVQPASLPTHGRCQTGPHDTVMISAAPQAERCPSDAAGWPGVSDRQNLQAAA